MALTVIDKKDLLISNSLKSIKGVATKKDLQLIYMRI